MTVYVCVDGERREEERKESALKKKEKKATKVFALVFLFSFHTF